LAEFISCYRNDNKPIVKGKDGILPNTYFNLLCLENGEKWEGQVEGFEVVCLVLKGNCDVEVDGDRFSNVGKREDMWSGKPESIYVPTGASVRIIANKDHTEIALTGGACEQKYEAFRVNQEEVDLIEVGSLETKTYRKSLMFLGKKLQEEPGIFLLRSCFLKAAGQDIHLISMIPKILRKKLLLRSFIIFDINPKTVLVCKSYSRMTELHSHS